MRENCKIHQKVALLTESSVMKDIYWETYLVKQLDIRGIDPPVCGRDVDGDLRHGVVHALEAVAQLIDGDDEGAEERLDQLAHGLLRHLVH